jgi:hypothetical protein
MSIRAALYARVSTNGNQNPQMQLEEMREYCKRRGWDIAGEYVDAGISGSKERRRCNPRWTRLSATNLSGLNSSRGAVMKFFRIFLFCTAANCAIAQPPTATVSQQGSGNGRAVMQLRLLLALHREVH